MPSLNVFIVMRQTVRNLRPKEVVQHGTTPIICSDDFCDLQLEKAGP